MGAAFDGRLHANDSASDLIAETTSCGRNATPRFSRTITRRPEIQDIADVVADSLAMLDAATELDAPILVICGVHFMARRRRSRIGEADSDPDPTAGARSPARFRRPMLRAWRARHPTGSSRVRDTAALEG